MIFTGDFGSFVSLLLLSESFALVVVTYCCKDMEIQGLFGPRRLFLLYRDRPAHKRPPNAHVLNEAIYWSLNNIYSKRAFSTTKRTFIQQSLLLQFKNKRMFYSSAVLLVMHFSY